LSEKISKKLPFIGLPAGTLYLDLWENRRMSVGSGSALPEGIIQIFDFHQDFGSETQIDMQMDFDAQNSAHVDSFASTSGPQVLFAKLNNATTGFEVLDVIFHLPEITGKGGQKPTFTR
jgi:hypothetical protein